jgi:hypothetical protein
MDLSVPVCLYVWALQDSHLNTNKNRCKATMYSLKQTAEIHRTSR